MKLPERIIKTLKCLLKQPCTAMFINKSLPCMNGYNYIHYLREKYGITILDKKLDGDTLKKYYIPECEKPKVREWLACFTEQAKQNINKRTKQINKKPNDKDFGVKR